VWHAFLDRYFPYQPPPAQPASSAKADAQLVSGRYITSRRAQTTIFKVFTVLGESKISSDSDGNITLDDLKDLNGKPKKLQEIGPLMFRALNDQDRVAFKRDEAERLVLVTDFPVFVFERSPWNENSSFNLPLIISALVIMLLSLLLWPVAALVRRHYGQKLSLTNQQRRLRLLVRLTCLFDLLFVVGFAVFFTMSDKDIGLLSPRFNPLLRMIQIVGWIGVVGTLVALYNALRSWQAQGRWFWSKLADGLVALACVAFVWFVFTWNLLHWSLRY